MGVWRDLKGVLSACLVMMLVILASHTTRASDVAALPGIDGLDTGGFDAPSFILSSKDRALYRRIFDLQEEGKIKAARALVKDLSDPILMGHVLEQRYMHPTAYRSRYKELRSWLANYADHPEANRIYKLALRRRGSASYPAKPRAAKIPQEIIAEWKEDQAVKKAKRSVKRAKKEWRSKSQRRKIRSIQRQIRSLVQRGSVTISLERLDSRANRKLFDTISRDESLGVIARGYFRYHKDKEAIAVAERVYKASRDKAPMAAWWGGLSAYRIGHFKTAGRLFASLAGSPYADHEHRAAGAFWAARSQLQAKRPERVSELLAKAAEHRRSFYGILAARSLGLDDQFNWSFGDKDGRAVQTLMEIPAVRRGFALQEVGQSKRAFEELQPVSARLPIRLMQAMTLHAEKHGMAALAFRIARYLERKTGMSLDAAMYPLPSWLPENGFDLDRALIFAFVRQESHFRSDARSPVGARGLMQLMPATAGYIAGTRFRGKKRDQLYDPSFNLSLGQKYLNYLMNLPYTGGNLFYTAVAYNGGPGNLLKWKERADFKGDPLLFIESIPSRETRHFVEAVLSNLWIYRQRLGQETPGLDAILAGNWPLYMGLDNLLDVDEVILETASE